MKHIHTIAITLTLVSLMMLMSAFRPFKNGKVILLVSVEVQNFAEWKKGFDNGAAIREKAGIKVISICSDIENENRVVVVEEAENAQSAHDFLTLLKSKEKEGSLNKLSVKIYDKVD